MFTTIVKGELLINDFTIITIHLKKLNIHCKLKMNL